MTNEQLLRALEVLPDSIILDALPPSWDPDATPAPRPKRASRLAGFFLDNGWVAAVLSAVVAIGVIVAIVLAGRGEGPVPPTGGTVDSESAESNIDNTPETESTTNTLIDEEGIPLIIPYRVTVNDPVEGTVERNLFLRVTKQSYSLSQSSPFPSPVGLHWDLLDENGDVLTKLDYSGYITMFASERDGNLTYLFAGLMPIRETGAMLFCGPFDAYLDEALSEPEWRFNMPPEYEVVIHEPEANTQLKKRFSAFMENLHSLFGEADTVTPLITSDPYLKDFMNGQSWGELSDKEIILTYWDSANIQMIYNAYDRLVNPETEPRPDIPPAPSASSVTIPCQTSPDSEEGKHNLSIRITPMTLSPSPDDRDMSPAGLRWELLDENGNLLLTQDLNGYASVFSAELDGETVYILTNFQFRGNSMNYLYSGILSVDRIDGEWKLNYNLDGNYRVAFPLSSTIDQRFEQSYNNYRSVIIERFKKTANLQKIITVDPYLDDFIESKAGDLSYTDALIAYWQHGNIYMIRDEWKRLRDQIS